ncbi:MAG TPA: hypothetical protein VFF63_09330 [Candidatus Babeliales bacterium]|nr:hypothetical protein [Candidatus Babeliales bacterium]
MKAIVKSAVISGAGALLLGASLALSSATVVSSATRAHSGANSVPAKATTCSLKSGYCLTVQNTGKGGAIEGTSSDSTGVVGISTSGEGLFAESSTSVGVQGQSTSDTAVLGDSSNGVGVSGSSSSSDGVDGVAENSGNGVSGTSLSGNGILGKSTSGPGGLFQNNSDSNVTLVAQNSSGEGDTFEAVNTATDDGFNVDDAGDGFFSGVVSATKFDTDQPARGGLHLQAFGSESTRAMIEDTGTARLEAGEGAVRFDSAFASAIDVARGYQVFLTPDGDTRGLYIAAKYEGGFIVRETEHGRSSLYFDYRVVAHPYGASDARLAQLQIKRLPIPRLPQHPQPRQP